MSSAISNLVIRNNNLVVCILCEGYITEITKSGLIVCWMTPQEMGNFNELLTHCSRSFTTKYRICSKYIQMRGPSGQQPTNCLTNAGEYLNRNSTPPLLEGVPTSPLSIMPRYSSSVLASPVWLCELCSMRI